MYSISIKFSIGLLLYSAFNDYEVISLKSNMSKVKTVYRCEQCGADHLKWAGQCSECGEWNCLNEVKLEPTTAHRARPKVGGYAGQVANITTLNKVSVSHETRLPTGISEFDRVLGGGLVTGSVVLIGGDPVLVNRPFFYKQQLTWQVQKFCTLYYG